MPESNQSNKLSFFAWNINGLFSKTLGDKLRNSDFLRAVLCKYRLSSFGREKMKSLKLSQKNGLNK